MSQLMFTGQRFLVGIYVWKEQTIANTSEQQFKIEFECEFLGSVDTLITPSKLKYLVFEKTIESNASLDVYERG